MYFYFLLYLISLCRTAEQNEIPTHNFPEKDVVNEDAGDEESLNLTDSEKEYFKIWPQGNVPYYIDNYSYKDKVLRDRIRNFLSKVNSLTDINFMELPSPPPDDGTRWVFFVNRRGLLGCADHSVTNFTTKGVQQVVLGYDCMSTRNELAEAILSIVGVPSQHNAPDRDNHIEIITENIIPDKRFLFNKINEKDWLFSHIDYDFKSAGHFDTHKHSRNGKATIRIKGENSKFSKLEKKLSVGDIKKMKILYKWKKTPSLEKCQKLLLKSNGLQTLQLNSFNNFNNIKIGGDFKPVNSNINIQNNGINIGSVQSECTSWKCAPSRGIPGSIPSKDIPSGARPSGGVPSDSSSTSTKSSGKPSTSIPSEGMQSGCKLPKCVPSRDIPSGSMPWKGWPWKGTPSKGWPWEGTPSKGWPWEGMPPNDWQWRGTPPSGWPFEGMPWGTKAPEGGFNGNCKDRDTCKRKCKRKRCRLSASLYKNIYSEYYE